MDGTRAGGNSHPSTYHNASSPTFQSALSHVLLRTIAYYHRGAPPQRWVSATEMVAAGRMNRRR